MKRKPISPKRMEALQAKAAFADYVIQCQKSGVTPTFYEDWKEKRRIVEVLDTRREEGYK